MVHRVFRLSISPERAPDVRRAVDFDGRSTLHDVHNVIQRELHLDNDHLYAFYLSGRYFDRASEHSLDPHSGQDSGRLPLFRLGLKAGQQFAYLFDFGDELRHTITVVSITDVATQLSEPVLVESVGDAPAQYPNFDEDDEEGDDEEPYQLPDHLAEVVPLAEAVLALSERLDELYEEDDAEHAPTSEDDGELAEVDENEDEEPEEEEDDEATSEGERAGPPEAILSLLRELSKAALELAGKLEQDEEALHELDEWSQDRELLPRLLELPLGLVNVGELDSALAVARAFTFVAAEPLNGDIAIIFAESGKREEAVTQLELNLKEFPESCLTAIKAGAAFEALGEMAGAEAAYRRALVLEGDDSEQEEAFTLLVGLLQDMGRFEEADALLSASMDDATLADAEPLSADAPRVAAKPLAPVGRNEPCPCGSGKKYKKCHGA